MYRKNLFIKLTILLYTIVVLHLFALYFSWYWSIWWYDIPMHFLGGFWIGGIALWLYFFRKKINTDNTINKSTVYIVSLLSVIGIGLLWELFEFSLDTFIIFQTNDIVDTLSDLGMDIIGALVVALYMIEKLKNIARINKS